MRVRIRYTKVGKVRFVGHRDVARLWERTLRKVRVPVAYSEGFSPRPRLSFGLALPTVAESFAEYLDVEIAGDVDPVELSVALNAALPVGFTVGAVARVEKSDPSLQEDVSMCSWRITLPGATLAAVATAAADALAAETLPLSRERKGEARVDDLRPAIVTLGAEEVDGAPVLLADLSTRPRGMRPSELLAVCFPAVVDLSELSARVLRTHQWIERDGARRELLPLDAAGAPCTDAVRA